MLAQKYNVDNVISGFGVPTSGIP